MNLKAIENYITQFPIYQYTFLNVNDIEFDDKVRNFCKKDCPGYGKSWSCPPAIGSLKQCKNKCMEYSHALLFSTTTELTSQAGKDGFYNSKKEHEELTETIEAFLRNEAYKCRTLSTEPCSICDKCTYPKKSCIDPDRMHPCIESHGIALSKLLEDNCMDYYMGEHMILRFSMIFMKEA